MDPKANTNSEHSPKITEAVQNDTNTLDIERVITAPDADIPHLSEKIVDGDIALTILQTHFDPFTPEEEKRVRRKIDFRMVPLMLLVNGIQYVDKNVGKTSPPSAEVGINALKDGRKCCHIWSRKTSPSQGA